MTIIKGCLTKDGYYCEGQNIGKKVKMNKEKHNCKECNDLAKFYTDKVKENTDRVKVYKDWAKKYSKKCQCEKGEKRE